MKLPRRNSKGISLLGSLVAVFILAAMGGAMAVLVSTNQATRSFQYTTDQSFASAQSALEMVLGYIHTGVNPCGYADRDFDFGGSTIVVNRTGGRIYVTATNVDSSTAVSVVDPSPPTEGTQLLIDTSNAKDASNGAPPKKLIDITFMLDPGCGNAVTITSLVVSWEPNLGEDVDQIKFDGNNVGGSNEVSGQTIDITDQHIADAGQHLIDFIRWGNEIQNRLYTLQFNFADGSSKTVTIDTR